MASAIGILLLAPCTTSALELGEASIKSGLGESLLVEIPYRLTGGERITSACVGLAPAEHAADALPSYARVSRISITPTHIEIFDERSVLEPLLGLNVDVHCAGAPHFVRSYQLFVDPPAQVPAILSNRPEVAVARTSPATPDATASVATRDPTASAAVVRTVRANASPRARGLAGGNLPQGQTYRVVRGDTLSGIAARIAGRPATILEAADAIFAANPAAFTRGNPDLIEEGRSITIPNLVSSTAALAATSALAPASVREAELPTAAPVAAVPTPALPNAAEPSHADQAASVTAAEASQPTPAAAPVVATPSAAPVAAPARANVAPEAPSPAATQRISASFIALVILAAAILLSASVAFVRRRRKQQAEAEAASMVQEPLRRRPVELASRMHVVEGSLTGTHAARHAAAMRAAAESAAVADSSAAVPPDLEDIVRAIGSTDAVDFNVGAPAVADERVDESGRAYILDARDDTVEESFPTARMPAVATDPTVRQQAPSSKPDDSEQPINDEKHTLTVVELDMLREDYETEHTLTQQSSQALRDALADLAVTKASHAATAETATLESPQVSQQEPTDSAADSPTARVRAK